MFHEEKGKSEDRNQIHRVPVSRRFAGPDENQGQKPTQVDEQLPDLSD
jgi:hypothetical protein